MDLTGGTGDSISSTGLFTAAGPAGRYVTVSATDANEDQGFDPDRHWFRCRPGWQPCGGREHGGYGASLSWSSPAYGTPISYTITTSPATAATTVDGNATSAEISGLNPNTRYLVTVMAVDGHGDQSAPVSASVRSTGSTAFTHIDAGYDSACGLRASGTIVCWGGNSYGESIPPASAFTQVSAGYYFACGIRATGGAAVCWGDNAYGVTSAPPGSFTQVSAGGDIACGVQAHGAAVCWGSGRSTPPSRLFQTGQHGE